MTTATATSRATALPVRLTAGIVAGLVGGLVFGIAIQALGMMPMVAALVGSDSVAAGWLVHLFNAALFGAIFALVLGRWATALGPAIGLGLLYGLLWWVLGALIIMPMWLGMDDMVLQLGETAWWSLAGHAMYGVLLGAVYQMLVPHLRRTDRR